MHEELTIQNIVRLVGVSNATISWALNRCSPGTNAFSAYNSVYKPLGCSW